MKVIAFAFLPLVIVYIMIRLFKNSLLKDGDKTKTAIFFILCALVYAVSVFLFTTL